MGPSKIPAKNLPQRLSAFSRELWNDQDFWIHALAVKGGASAVVVTGIVGISYVVALPFFVAALGIALCGGLIGLGLYGFFLGAAKAWSILKVIYYRTISATPQPKKTKAAKPLHQRLADSASVQKWLHRPVVRKLLKSRAWKVANTLTQRQQELFLSGLAGTGSIFWSVISALTLITNIIVLPVVALGSLLTFGTVLAAGSLLSGVYGIYLSLQGLLRSLRGKKQP